MYISFKIQKKITINIICVKINQYKYKHLYKKFVLDLINGMETQYGM